jgi:transposase
LVRIPFRGQDAFIPKKFSPEFRAKAVRLVVDHREDYRSEHEAIGTVSERLGLGSETLRHWVRQAEVDAGDEPGVTTDAARQIRDLKRKNAELERTVEILRAASVFFAAELDPPLR